MRVAALLAIRCLTLKRLPSSSNWGGTRLAEMRQRCFGSGLVELGHCPTSARPMADTEGPAVC